MAGSICLRSLLRPLNGKVSPVEEIGKMKMTDVVESMYGGGGG